MADWTVIIPVKPAAVGKTRLGGDAPLAHAIALDTIAAAASGAPVGRVIVVTADESLAREATAVPGSGAVIEAILEPAPAGIGAAIALGLSRTRASDPRAVLLGDLPGLLGAELAAALAAAERHDRAFVPDAEDTGTTLVTARSGVALVERFGPDSAAAHLAEGLTRLDLPADSSLRRDIDLPEQLADPRAIGPRTRAALAASAQA